MALLLAVWPDEIVPSSWNSQHKVKMSGYVKLALASVLLLSVVTISQGEPTPCK